MSVLVEALSVIVNKSAIVDRFPGGIAGFVNQVPNQTYCADARLVRVGFMLPPDVADFIQNLEACGLTYLQNGRAKDLVVVDQIQGLMAECEWLKFGRRRFEDGMISFVRSVSDNEQDVVVVPIGWQFQNSLSHRHTFIPNESIDERLEPLSSETGVTAFRDTETGKTVYAGSPIYEKRSTEAKQISRIVQRALELEETGNQAGDCQAIEYRSAALKELEEKLLPKAKAMSLSAMFHTAYAHYAYGMVLRILGRLDDAIEQYGISLSHAPDQINTLLEIVRCLGNAGRPKEAEVHAVHAVQMHPSSPQAWGNLASILIQLGDQNAARIAIVKALELEPNNPVNRHIRNVFNRRFGSR